MALSCTALVMVALLLGFMGAGAVACDHCVYQSRASYFVPPIKKAKVSRCAFTETVSKAAMAAASQKIYRDGDGCGECWGLRCRNKNYCSTSWVKVMITDFTDNNQTDFVLMPQNFKRMARTGNAMQLLMKKGSIPVEYQRIPCEFPGGSSMSVRIDRRSVYPRYLALQFLYHGGQTDIQTVEMAAVGSSNWRALSRSNGGGIWAITNPPTTGPLRLRLRVAGGYESAWVFPNSNRNVLPQNWVPGAVLPQKWVPGKVYRSRKSLRKAASRAHDGNHN